MWIHKSKNTYNFSGIFFFFFYCIKVIMAEGEFVRWDMLKVMDLHIRGYIRRSLGKKYCTDLTVNILKVYSSKPWINIWTKSSSSFCQLVNTVKWGMHGSCMGKVHNSKCWKRVETKLLLKQVKIIKPY